jgi:hypothetical protein
MKTARAIMDWILKNQTKTIVVLFSVIFLFALALPQGGGFNIGFGSTDGPSTHVNISEGVSEKTAGFEFKHDSIPDTLSGN